MTHGKISQVPENIYAAETVGHRSIQIDAIDGRARLPKVVTATGVGVRVRNLVVRFSATAVSLVWATEIQEAGDVDAGNVGVVRAEHSAAVCDLKAQIAHRLRRENCRPRTDNGFIPDEAAAPCARVGPARRIEGVTRFTIVRERISKHEGILRVELMIDLRGRLCFRPRYWKQTVVDVEAGKSRTCSAANYLVDSRRERRTDKGIILPAVVFLFERCVVK